jgi:hypothetical protein
VAESHYPRSSLRQLPQDHPLPGHIPEFHYRESPTIFINPPTLRLGQEDGQYFNHLRCELVQVLSGLFYFGFWHRIVASECTRNETVRSLVLAIGALSHALHFVPSDEIPESDLQPTPSATPHKLKWNKSHQAACKHTMKALSMLSEQTASNLAKSRTVFISALLLATIEVLWGNIHSAELILARSIIEPACFVKRGDGGLDPVCGASSPRLLPSIDDEIDGVSHLLPRIFASTSLSPLSGHLSEKETIKALKTSTKCRFPDQHADSIRKIILMWSDFITRCSMFTSQCM